jgi:hypothetical protein
MNCTNFIIKLCLKGLSPFIAIILIIYHVIGGLKSTLDFRTLLLLASAIFRILRYQADLVDLVHCYFILGGPGRRFILGPPTHWDH